MGDTDEEDLKVLFENFGVVNDVHIAHDWRTGEQLSYGFIEMPNDGEAEMAIEKMDGKRWNGRWLKVSEKQSRSPKY
jgi:RNA recognition motif-containing protein